MSAAVRVRGLVKAYGSRQAVRGLDLDVAHGEVVALLGPNGAGKTSTVEILEGHRRRDAGEVAVLGEDPGTAGRAWRARIGIVLQEVSDAGMLTVAETVTMYAACYRVRRGVADVLGAVGLEALADARVRGLSGGQRRRLDVALGIVGRPELLFLDEPTTGFDPEARRAFWTLIRGLAADGTTVLLTTHYLEEAAALADRVAVVCRGAVVACDSPAVLTAAVTGTATVRWTDADGVHEERTASPTDLIRRRAAAGGELAGLTVTRPTLEDAYLRLIGAA